MRFKLTKDLILLRDSEHHLFVGGCDTSGWNNTNDNVYCENCDILYQVNVSKGIEINQCVQCGSSDILLREDYMV